MNIINNHSSNYNKFKRKMVLNSNNKYYRFEIKQKSFKNYIEY